MPAARSDTINAPAIAHESQRRDDENDDGMAMLVISRLIDLLYSVRQVSLSGLQGVNIAAGPAIQGLTNLPGRGIDPQGSGILEKLENLDLQLRFSPFIGILGAEEVIGGLHDVPRVRLVG